MAFRGLSVVLITVAVIAPQLASAYWDGIVSIDTSTFPKIVTNDKTTLVKFDRKNPHGNLMDEWRAIAQKLGEDVGAADCDVVLAEVNCHNELWWNDNSYFNMDLANLHNVTFDGDYRLFQPRLKLFKRGQVNKPVTYSEEDITSLGLQRFLQQHTNADFGLDGVLAPLSQLATEALDVFHQWFQRKLPEPSYETLRANLTKRVKAAVIRAPSDRNEDADYYASVISHLIPEVASLRELDAHAATKRQKKQRNAATGSVPPRKASSSTKSSGGDPFDDVGYGYLDATWRKLRKTEREAAKARSEEAKEAKKTPTEKEAQNAAQLSDSQYGKLVRKINILSSVRFPGFVDVVNRVEVPSAWDIKKRLAPKETEEKKVKKPKPWHRPEPKLPDGAAPAVQPPAPPVVDPLPSAVNSVVGAAASGASGPGSSNTGASTTKPPLSHPGADTKGVLPGTPPVVASVPDQWRDAAGEDEL